MLEHVLYRQKYHHVQCVAAGSITLCFTPWSLQKHIMNVMLYMMKHKISKMLRYRARLNNNIQILTLLPHGAISNWLPTPSSCSRSARMSNTAIHTGETCANYPMMGHVVPCTSREAKRKQAVSWRTAHAPSHWARWAVHQHHGR